MKEIADLIMREARFDSEMRDILSLWLLLMNIKVALKGEVFKCHGL